MKLYYSPGACSLSPHIVLNEAGYDFELERVDLKAHSTASGTPLAAIHAKNYVPILELDDGTRLTEGPVIVQYLADQRPAAGLIAPVGTQERYRVLEWLNFTTSELHKTFYAFFHPELPADGWRDFARKKLATHYAYVDGELGERAYLLGEQFTVADAYLFTILNWSKAADLDLAQWPRLARYYGRVAARPHVQRTLQAEGLKVPQVAQA
jgi:glutathione S-transferase